VLKMKIALSAVLLSLVGCTSIKSTILQRDESNTHWQTIEAQGIPITLEVPTHLRIAIIDTKYYFKSGNGWEPLKKGSVDYVSTQVDHSFLRTKKVFTIDPKRPAAGENSFRFDLAEDKQYLSKIESDVTDRTIEEASSALERLLIAIRPGKGTGAAFTAPGGGPKLYQVTSVRAIELVEIDDPMFEQNVSHFICQHVPASCLPDCEFRAVVPPLTAPTEPSTPAIDPNVKPLPIPPAPAPGAALWKTFR